MVIFQARKECYVGYDFFEKSKGQNVLSIKTRVKIAAERGKNRFNTYRQWCREVKTKSRSHSRPKPNTNAAQSAPHAPYKAFYSRLNARQ